MTWYKVFPVNSTDLDKDLKVLDEDPVEED